MKIRLTLRWGGWVAETSSLLNCRTGNGTESSNLSLTAIILKDNRSGRSSARLECLLWEQEAAGSNPAAPTETINLVDGFFMYTKMPTFTRELVFIEWINSIWYL